MGIDCQVGREATRFVPNRREGLPLRTNTNPFCAFCVLCGSQGSGLARRCRVATSAELYRPGSRFSLSAPNLRTNPTASVPSASSGASSGSGKEEAMK